MLFRRHQVDTANASLYIVWILASTRALKKILWLFTPPALIRALQLPVQPVHEGPHRMEVNPLVSLPLPNHALCTHYNATSWPVSLVVC